LLAGKQIKNKVDTGRNDMLAEKIKKDLAFNLQKKGVDLSAVHVDFNSGSMNVRVSINKWI